MVAFFKKHLAAILTGTAFNLPALWKGVVWLTDWLSRFDLWRTYGRELPGAAAVIGYLLNPPPWTVFLTGTVGVLIVLWDVRRQAKTPAIVVPEIALDPHRRLRFGFYSFCAAIGISVWVVAWPVMFPARPASPPAQPKPVAPAISSPPARSTMSTMERVIYQCHRLATDQKTEEARLVEFRKYIEAYADTNGYAFKVNAVPGGRKAELTAATPLGQKNMGNAVKMTFEVRTIGKDLLGIFMAEYQASIWANYRLPEGSDTEKTLRKRIEDLVDVEPGACQLQ